jgi:FkbM family methyltransferase
MIKHNIKSIGEMWWYEDLNVETFEFRREKFSELIEEDSIVLDIGASVGYFSLLFGGCIGEKGKVISFEPNPKTFSVLKQHSELNPKLNIVPFNYAVTKETKPYTFYYSDPNVFGNGMNGGNFNEVKLGDQIKQFHNYPVEVNGVNIYDFLLKNFKDELHKIKFIKIDTEGYDKEVLKILSPLIKQNKPLLMVESFKSSTKEEILDYFNTIKSLDYNIYDVSPLDNKTDCVGPIALEEFEYYTYNIVDNGNWFCFHKDELYKYNLPSTISGKTAAIVSNRNDGYKEKERFIIHLTTLLETFDEVIYVDWNSPTQSFIYDILNDLPKTNRLKHIVISKEVHNMFANNIPDLPNCYDSLAFNIALKRTDAEWIVATTSDIIPPFKTDFINFLKTCNKNTFYTLSRREVDYNEVIENKHDLFKYRKHLNETTSPRYFPTKVTPNDNYSLINCCGDFQLATKNIFLKIRGYEENMCYKCFTDTNIQKKAVLYGFNLEAHYDLPLYHMSHKNILPQDGNTENIHEVADKTPPRYNDAWEWVEYFDKYIEHEHIMISRNSDVWGLGDVEIEYEII